MQSPVSRRQALLWKTGCPGGFALVVTLVLMVLLSILALGLLSLANIELRNTGRRDKTRLARQNAILALNLAIGELQKNLGPDQRTSANAALIDSSFEETNPHWVGVWNTEGGFRNWLVSGNENVTQPANPEDDAPDGAIRFSPGTAATADTSSGTGYTIGSTPAVLLVGKNSLGPAAEKQGNPVHAPVQEIKTSSSQTVGRYAWWVGDDGAKANLAAPVLALPEGDTEERLLFLAGSPNRGFPTIGGEWEKWLPDGDEAALKGTEGKFVSRNQVPLAEEGLSDREKERFHDFTVASAGVLSDSKNGGLRKDLSIAFEIPEKSFANSEFTRVLAEGDGPNAYATDHGSPMKSSSPFKGRPTKTIVNYEDPQFPSGSYYRGPTFDLLRDHYQLYRRFSDPFSANASVKAQHGAPNVPDYGRAPWQDYSDRGSSDIPVFPGIHAISDTGADGKTSIRQLTTELVPEFIHYAYTASLQCYKVSGDPAGMSRIRLIINPFIALYNPYNVVVESPPIHMRVARISIAISLQYLTNPVTSQRDYNRFSLLDPNVDQDRQFSMGAGYQKVDHYISDSGDPHPPTSGGAGITLQPGEIKLYTITGGKPVNVDEKFQSSDKALAFQAVDTSDPSQLFSSGIYTELRYTTDNVNEPFDTDDLDDPFLIGDSDQFTVLVDNGAYFGSSKQNKEFTPKLGNNFNEYLLILQNLVQPFTGNPQPDTPKNWPEVREIRVWNGSYWQGDPLDNTPLTLTPDQIRGDPTDAGGGQRSYVAQSDVFWKPALGVDGSDNNFSLATHNPRAPGQSTTAAGGQGPNSTRGAGTWTGSSARLDGSVPSFDLRFWGTGKDIQDGGSRFITLWDIPRRPLTSLASFQHANVGRLWTGPAFVIGNSYASPYVPSDALVRKSGDPEYWNFDDSYLFNEALFDSYFFSGINPGMDGQTWRNSLSDSSVRLGSGDSTSEAPLQEAINEWIQGAGTFANPRIVFSQPAAHESAREALDLAESYKNPQTDLSDESDIRPHNALAAFALNHGAFNVNSVSIEAWRAVLAGMRDAAIDHFSSPTSFDVDSVNSTTPLPGSTLPGAGSGTGDDAELWNGYRRLSDVEIENLATGIVAQIKERSRDASRPLTTLGEFVNRRLGNDEFAQAGVIQAAIDDSGLNDPAKLSSQPVGAAETNYRTNKKLPLETVTDEYSNPEALASSTIAGTPQWLTQADVLESIGPQLSARSDTFTVRAYGESVDPSTGLVDGRAWLEATVQRGTGFVDPSDHPALPLSSLKSPANKDFGRRFSVVAFRWLSPSEI